MIKRIFLGIKLYIVAFSAVILMSIGIDIFANDQRRAKANKEYEYVFRKKPR